MFYSFNYANYMHTQLFVCACSACFRIRWRCYKQKCWDKRIALSVVKYWQRKYCAHLCSTEITVICFTAFFIAPVANAGGRASKPAAVVFFYSLLLLLLFVWRHLTGSITFSLCSLFRHCRQISLAPSIICIHIIGSEQMWFLEYNFLFVSSPVYGVLHIIQFEYFLPSHILVVCKLHSFFTTR